MRKCIYILLLLGFNWALSAQIDYQIQFKGNEFVPQANLRTYVDTYQISQDELVEDFYYRLIQFNKTPSVALHQKIADLGISLISYIPNKAYIVAIPVQFNPEHFIGLDIRFISAINLSWITAEAMYREIPDWAKAQNKIQVSIRYPSNLSAELFASLCKLDNIEITVSNAYNNVVHALIQESDIALVAALPYVHYLDLIPSPSIPDDIHGRALHKANRLDRQLPGELNINGAGVGVLTRDDGQIGPHIDFQGRLDQTFCGPSRGTHGDGVSGIFAGAGNLDPRMRGMASGADLHVIDYAADFLDETMDLHLNYNVLVTNSSYSNGCNAGYTNSTNTVDQQCFDNPTLMHIFSAGNSNNQDCDYGAGSQWGNITGGHKQGKNVVATANTDKYGEIAASSSRGPAFDGRIKPDISANGASHMSTAPNNDYLSFGGTSGAAPGIAGVMAMLHQGYRELFSQVAEGALLKALLLNTADEKGKIGPDFIFGWGMVNAYRAYKSMENNQFLKGQLTQGETKQYSLTIPDNVAALRVMVYWHDQEAASGVTRALVNDIDIKVNDGATDHLPWILDHTPDGAALNTAATKGVDHLNNMEQVSIESPIANSTYTLEVTGTDLPFGTHDFYVVWEYRMDGVVFTFPAGGEKVNNTDADILHWEAYDNDGDFLIEITIDEGASWIEIANVDESARLFETGYPNITTDKAQFRITRNGNATVSNTFTIANQPRVIELVSICPDSVLVEWDIMPGAVGYEVYLLGQKYMDLHKYSVNNSTYIAINAPTDVNWLAVSADYGNGVISRRSIAVPLQAFSLLDCAQDNDLKLTSIDHPSVLQSVSCNAPYEDNISLNIYNQGMLAATNISVSYTVNNGPVSTEVITDVILPDSSLVYSFIAPFSLAQTGSYEFNAWVSTANEASRFDDSLSIEIPFYLDNGSLGLSENFSASDDFPDFWVAYNPDNGLTWDIEREEQINNNRGNVLVMPFGSYSGSNQVDELSLLPLNMTSASSNAKLKIDMCYMEVFNSLDVLKVLVSTDCGQSFPDTLASWSNRELLTSDKNLLQPDEGDDWKTRYIDVGDYVGLNQVIFKLMAINGSGNNLYLDNFEVDFLNFSNTNANYDFNAANNCILTSFDFNNLSTGNISEYYWDFGLDAEPEYSTQENPPAVFFKTPGLKQVKLITINGAGRDTISQDITIYGNPTGTISSSQLNKGLVYFESNVAGAMDYQWTFGDGGMSNEVSPSHFYTNSGVYEVELVASNDCRTRSFKLDLNLDVTSVSENDLGDYVNVFPNPSQGVLHLDFTRDMDLQMVEIINVNGQVLTKLNIPHLGSTKGLITLDLSTYSAGIYLIKLKVLEDTIIKRVLIQR